MKIRKTAALLLACVLLLSLCACFNVKINLPEVPVSSTAPAESTTAYIPPATTAAPESTTAYIPPATTAAPESTTAYIPPASTAAPTEAPTEAPKTPDQMDAAALLQYFNDTLNRVKTDKVGFTKSKLTSILDLQLSNSAANTLVGFVKGALLKETADVNTVAKGQSGNDVFSPSGKPYVSNLTAADITGIKCEKSANNYIITVNVKSETNPAEGSAMSRGFDYMTVDDVMNIYAPKVGATVSRENIEVVFSDCSCTLTVNQSGYIQSYSTYVKGVMNMKDASIKKVITINTDLAITLASTTDYTNFQY